MTVRAAIQNARARNNTSYQDLSYLDGSPYTMQLLFTDYSYAAAGGGETAESRSVTLPLPSSLQDAYGVRVSGYELEGTGALAAGVAQSVSGASRANDITEALQRLRGDAQGFIDSAGASTVGPALSYAARQSLTALSRLGFENIDRGVAAGSGTVVNPHQTVVFDGVDLKQYDFSWTLSPKSREEADTIADMITTIKREIHPTYELQRSLLRYPSLVRPVIHGISEEHTFTFNIGMIGNLQVDYSPNGMALNRGGIPSVVNLSMNFTEARIRTSQDFGGGSV